LLRGWYQRYNVTPVVLSMHRRRCIMVPHDRSFADYMLRLEQLLAVRSANMDGAKSNFLSGEREILLGNIALCADQPSNVTVRILLAQTVLTMHNVAPVVVSEFRDRLFLLQRQSPLGEPAQTITQRMISEAIEAKP
jgi:hypothetical protein